MCVCVSVFQFQDLMCIFYEPLGRSHICSLSAPFVFPPSSASPVPLLRCSASSFPRSVIIYRASQTKHQITHLQLTQRGEEKGNVGPAFSLVLVLLMHQSCSDVLLLGHKASIRLHYISLMSISSVFGVYVTFVSLLHPSAGVTLG